MVKGHLRRILPGIERLKTINGVADMNDLLIAVVSGLIGVLGAVIGSVVTGGLHRSHARKERLLIMHAEFNSSTMTAARSRAESMLPTIFKIPPGAGRHEILQRYPDRYASYTGYWEVLNFYRRLAVLFETEDIDTKLAATLFGDLFTWWYLSAYCHHLRGTGWYLEIQIHELWRVLTLECGLPPKKFDVWMRAAQAGFEVQLKESSTTHKEHRVACVQAAKPQWLQQWRSQHGYQH